jgi:predicted phosphate transport protein (TIGR00153 family)
MRFFTRDESFFDEFQKQGNKTVEGCQVFVDMLKAAQGIADVQAAAKRISDIEHECDHITHAVVAKLHTTFITPLDRNDIYRLITKMDDIMDYIEAAAERMSLYELSVVTQDVTALADVLLQSTQRVSEAVSSFRDLKRPQSILDKCIEINRLENVADSIFRTSLARLFREEKDPITIMKWKEVFELLETATDRCEDVANIIEGVVLENS